MKWNSGNLVEIFSRLEKILAKTQGKNENVEIEIMNFLPFRGLKINFQNIFFLEKKKFQNEIF